MNIEKLGCLEEVSLRAVWEREDTHFTPWLSKHLKYLSDVIGIDLEYVKREAEIGPGRFRADIVARDPQNNVVMIENQLEAADLHHLGQVLAYLAGLDAHIVIWVARSFDEPYLSAVRWLNDHTEAPFAFLAVRIRVVKIGDSPAAPIFEVLEKPNEWDRQVKDIVADPGVSKLGQFRRRFWNHVAQRHPDVVKPNYAGSNVNHPVEGSDLQISLYVMIDRGCGIFLTTRRGVGSDAKTLIDPYREPLRDALAEQCRQDDFELGEYAGTSLKVDSSDENNWDSMADWLRETMAVYEKVLRNSSV